MSHRLPTIKISDLEHFAYIAGRQRDPAFKKKVKVIELIASGHSVTDVVRLVGLSASTVRRLVMKYASNPWEVYELAPRSKTRIQKRLANIRAELVKRFGQRFREHRLTRGDLQSEFPFMSPGRLEKLRRELGIELHLGRPRKVLASDRQSSVSILTQE